MAKTKTSAKAPRNANRSGQSPASAIRRRNGVSDAGQRSNPERPQIAKLRVAPPCRALASGEFAAQAPTQPENVIDLAAERERRAPFDPIKARAEIVRNLIRVGSDAYFSAITATDANDRAKCTALINGAERAFAMACELLAEIEAG